MALSAVVEKEVYDALPDTIKAEYKSGTDTLDGKFILDVTKVEGFSLENVDGMRTALESERGTVKELNSKVKLFDGLDATKAREALKQLESLGDISKLSSDDKVKQQIDSIKQQLTENHNGVLTTKESEIKELFEQLQVVMIDSVASKALHEAEVENIDLLLPHVRNQTKMIKGSDGKYAVEIIKADGTTRISPSGSNNMSIGELATEFKGIWPQAFKGSGGNGMGGSPGQGGTPGSGSHTISAADAKDTGKYRAARDAADKAGAPLEILS